MSSRWSSSLVARALAVGGVLAVLLGLALGSTANGLTPRTVTLHVDGAMFVSVYCDGETVHAQGTDIQFRAARTECDVEAPLTAVMPLRGTLTLGKEDAYVCSRRGTGLRCTPASGSGP